MACQPGMTETAKSRPTTCAPKQPAAWPDLPAADRPCGSDASVRRTAPTHRQETINVAAHAAVRSVAQRRKIGDQSDVPEHQRHQSIRRNGEYVPLQRTAKLRPHTHRIWIGKQPIEDPRTTEVEQGKQGCAGDGKQRHGLGETVDACPPGLVQQEQDCRNQRASVPDSDPPHEVDNRKAPADRNIDAPNTCTNGDKIDDGVEHHHRNQKRDAKAQPPARRGTSREYDRADFVSDGGDRCRAKNGVLPSQA